jgi:hypothetical protein
MKAVNTNLTRTVTMLFVFLLAYLVVIPPVMAQSGGPLCFVQFDDFARFAEQWLYTGTGLAGDIDKDNDVDIEDLKRFADYWLACCPYNWTLR